MTDSTLPTAIERFFRAMQAGATSEAQMMALFSDEAEYVEPFSGQVQTHVGKAAIRQTFVQGWQYPLPDMTLQVDRFDISGDVVRVDWTCHSPGLPGGKGEGTNVFTLSRGMIVRLVTSFR
jgi:SnoaL-like domain